MRTERLLELSRSCGRLFMRLMGLSWRMVYSSPSRRRSGSRRGAPVLYAFWHGRQLPLIHTHRNEGITVLVSRNVDGQYVTNVLHSMGFDTVRGSSSSGGMRAVGEMAGLLRSGTDCAITPDGPRGPANRAKTGTGVISRMGRRPVVPMGTSAFPAVRFSSWDGFILPLPFSRVTVVEGRPLPHLRRGESTEKWLEMLETSLNSVTSYADLLASPGIAMLQCILRAAGCALSPLAAAALRTRPRRERRERTGHSEKTYEEPIWLHGSSLGELNGLLPYYRYLEDLGMPVFITCCTPAGREFISKNGLRGSFTPLDLPEFAERFIDTVSPSALIIAETEIWPITILSALRKRIPCMMVNARISRKSMRRYGLLGPFVGRMLSCFSGILSRSGKDRENFIELGVDPSLIKVSGDSKMLADSGDPPPVWRDLIGTSMPIIVAGSTREGEEETVLRASREAGYFPVIAPRHLERVGIVKRIAETEGMEPILWSSLTGGDGPGRDYSSIIVDVHGALARMYGVGDVSFVGGTVTPLGGHNVIEPLMRGVPVVIGRHYHNFTEIVDRLMPLNVVHIFSSEEELTDILKNLRNTGPESTDVLDGLQGIRETILSDFREMLGRAGVLKTL